LRENETEEHSSSVFVVWSVFIVTVVFLITGVVYMYLKPALRTLGQG
jgi:hypothetical protein